MDHAEALWELEQIKRLKARYFRLQDQDRWDEWALLFTEDFEGADPLEEGVILHGGAALAARTAELAGASSRAHRGTLPDIELIDDENAAGTWALVCASTVPTDGGSFTAWILGYYTDEYRKGADGNWRIRRMRYNNDLTITDGDPAELL
ncbi:MAG TPA: nuclear transport factor 2 family protein [Acidimicrobiales bacterium]